jgi:phosphoglycolate phosphatase-like HAD superfamily hydrolase
VDGTLFSSDHILSPAYAAAVAAFNAAFGRNVPVPSLRRILEQIGRPSPVIMDNLFPELNENERAWISSASRANLINLIRQGRAFIYPGVPETLAGMKKNGLLLKTASNGNPDYLHAVYDAYGFHEFFGKMKTIYDPGLSDKGDILARYLAEFSLQAGEMAMVGDRLSDLEAAQKAGCRFIGVTYGHADESEFRDVPFRAERFDLLPGLVASLQ